MHKHKLHSCAYSMFLPGYRLKIRSFFSLFEISFLLFFFTLCPLLTHTHWHTRTCAHTQEENFNSICRGRNQSHISLVNPQWLSTDPDTNKVLSRWGQGLRRRTEWEERPAVWGPTDGWHCSSAIMGLVYGREGCRKEAAEIEGRERGTEKERKRKGGGKIDPICGMMVN